MNEIKPPFEVEQPQTELASSEQLIVSLERTAIDAQVATAKKYPRTISRVLADAEAAVSASAEIAEGCFYTLKRRNKDGTEQIIEGPSVRLAEIIASAWGNIRTGARIIEINEKFVKAQGVAIDLEKNTATTTEVMRRITGKTGSRFSDDMIAVTANAAMAIARRNAIMGVIPRLFIMELMHKAQQVAAGNQLTLPAKRDRWLKWWASKGVPEKALLAWLGVTGVEDIQTEHIKQMAGLKTSLEDGDTTIEREFGEWLEKKDAPQQQQIVQAPAQSPQAAQAAPQQTQTVAVLEQKTPHDILREKLADAKITEEQFMRWAVKQKLAADGAGLDSISSGKLKTIVEKWSSIVTFIQKQA